MLDLPIKGRAAIARRAGGACAMSLAHAGTEVMINARLEARVGPAAEKIGQRAGAARRR
jgi:hypothetical protein